MTLTQLLETGNYDTDKQTIHNYVDGYYEYEFATKQNIPITLLEIGVGKGYSIKLWHDYFVHGTIIGVDINDWAVEMFEYTPRVKIFQADAYSKEFYSKFPDETFDYIIDDGPHTITYQLDAIYNWLPKVKRGGKLIIEDVPDIKDIKQLELASKPSIATYYRAFDFRNEPGHKYTKGWGYVPDDIIFEITRK
jgi:hypothetical protein